MNQIQRRDTFPQQEHLSDEIVSSIIDRPSLCELLLPHPTAVALAAQRDVDVARYNLAESVMTSLVKASPLPIKEISIKEQTGWFFYDKKITFKVKYL